MIEKKGSLVNVGLGMTLGAHITPIAKTFIEQADVVFVSASNRLVEEWVRTMNPNMVSLQSFYAEGKSRLNTYREMTQAILDKVREGKKVCGAFYGHPGVFALPPHETIRIAREEGFQAHMEPGISAEDCLYADLGIDPGKLGCTHFEASQFLFNHRQFDPSAYLILWQVGIAGDKSLKVFETSQSKRQLLTDLLLKTYPSEHLVTLYECAVLPIESTKIVQVPLVDLAMQEMSMKTTLVVPPATKKVQNIAMIEQAALLD
ncbi:MAG: SAM-dependent methyltransferase [Marinicella sp.]|nr:hypothetical protein [Xanthomonadales bacterium]